MTDTERLDWIEKRTNEGACPCIVNDDDGNFAVSFDGFQPVPQGEGKGYNEMVSITAIVDIEQWKPSIREAIDYAIEKEKECTAKN